MCNCNCKPWVSRKSRIGSWAYTVSAPGELWEEVQRLYPGEGPSALVQRALKALLAQQGTRI